MKKLAILGSTGSIGRQTLEVVRAFPDKFEVVALACGSNILLLRQQIDEFRPRLICTDAAEKIEGTSNVEYASLEEIVSSSDVDLVVMATSGKAGLSPTLAAIHAGKTIALANKEVLVMAGEIVMGKARRHNVDILPVDSEHSAIWQCLRGENDSEVAKILLTASGGPFRSRSSEQLATVTPEEALAHPTWQMGKKVTIDSATLMNKGMEIIEARWLFDVTYSQIEVIIHPQSIVHSMVEYADGSTKAQLSMPDMRLPIQYALTYPERWRDHFKLAVDFSKVGSLQFEKVNFDKFPCLRLAIEAGEKGGTYPSTLSAADEVAVELFLEKKIGFLDIPRVLEDTLTKHTSKSDPSMDDILNADSWARETAREWCSR